MNKEITYIKLSKISLSSINPRKSVNEESLNELAESLKLNGMISPICVRPKESGQYEIVYGERRYLAAKLAIMKEIPCLVRELSDEEAEDLSITENLQRVDISQIDEAHAYRLLQEHRNVSIQDLATRFGKSVTYIAQRLALNNLIEPFSVLLEKEIISIGVSIEISKLTSQDQVKLFDDMFNGITDSQYQRVPTIKALRKYISDRFQYKLQDAIFDTDKVYEGIDQPCSQCNKNTAVNGFLFPEMVDDARCTDGDCHKLKKDIHFREALKSVTENEPNTILAVPTWIYGSDKEEAAALKDEGYIIHVFSSADILDEPEQPDPDDYDPEEYSKALDEYDEEKKEYQRLINDPNTRKAMFVAGSDKGKICYLRPENEEENRSVLDASDLVESEKIKGLRSQLNRINDLKFARIYKDVLAKITESDYCKSTDELNASETAAMMLIMLPYCSDELKEAAGYDILEHSSQEIIDAVFRITPEMHLMIIRHYIINRLSVIPDYELSPALALINLAKEYDYAAFQAIETDREKEYAKRKAKIEAALNELTNKPA